MAFLDYSGLQRYTSKFKAWINSIVGSSEMGTTADTLTGAIAEHTEHISALESANPVLAVNHTSPDSSGNVDITAVDYAYNLVADDAQSSYGEFIYRTTGGDASLSDGDAWVSTIRGRSVHAGYTPESLDIDVEAVEREEGVPSIQAAVDRDTFVSYVLNSGTYTFIYASEWTLDSASINLEDYGITVTNEPVDDDEIIVNYVKEIRGTITTATPDEFRSTGWNLYNYDTGYARAIKYSDVYGFRVGGTYSSLEFSTTVEGTKSTITPVDGWFTVPSDGYVWVNGGDNTSTYVYMTWSDWISAPGKTYESYTESTISLTSIMENFDYGLCQVGAVVDTIDFDLGVATSNIDRMAYNAENLAIAVASGRNYEYDENYIYIIRETPVTYSFSPSETYAVSDHGIEFFTETSIPVYISMLYGQNLRDKLRTDVVTISSQNLTSAQKTQVRTNIGAPADSDVVKLTGDQTVAGTKTFTGNITTKQSSRYKYFYFKNNANSVCGYILHDSGNATNITSSRFNFTEFSPKSTADTGNTGFAEIYYLPAAKAGLAANAKYDILTSKDAVTVAQGGTGATTVAGARNALGLGNTSGAVPIANGGTGATTAADALTKLGALSTTGTAAKATKLATARSLYVSLGTAYDSSSPVTFDGAANKALPVNGTLAISHGGTGMTDSTVSEGTTNNISYQCVKWGKVCSVHFNTASGGISTAVSAGGTLFTLPSGYRPYRSLYAVVRHSSGAYEVGVLETTGVFKMVSKAIAKSDSFFAEMCYVMN